MGREWYEYVENVSVVNTTLDVCVVNQPPGLTKREWFAGMAMQGLLASNRTAVVQSAVEHADAIIKALSEQES